jgi:cyanate permease
MTPLHGCFSLGSLAGALLGFGFNTIDLAVVWHLALVGAVAAVVLILAARHVPARTGIAPANETGSPDRHGARVWSDPVVLAIGFIAMSMALAEGTANEWLPLIMVDGHGFSAELGSVFYATFAATMAIGRFGGGLLVSRFGRAPVFRVSAAAAAVGMTVVSLVDSPIAAVPAVILWGLGISLGFPLALSSAADSGDEASAAARVSAMATIGYLALLAGPPTLGLLGEAFGLRAALLLPLALVVVALSLSRVIRTRDTELFASAPH